MEGKVAVILLASVFSVVLLARHATAEPLEDQLPDTTGLFFGKRASHPNMNNLLFGRRSGMFEQLSGASKFDMVEARRVCRSVRQTCQNWGLDDDN